MKICSYGAGAIGYDSRRSNSSARPRMTLLPGDLIRCGTSVGVGVMKGPVSTVSIVIDGTGELLNETSSGAA